MTSVFGLGHKGYENLVFIFDCVCMTMDNWLHKYYKYIMYVKFIKLQNIIHDRPR